MALWIWNSSNGPKFPALWREQQCSPAVGADQREEAGDVAMAIAQPAVGDRNAAVHVGAFSALWPHGLDFLLMKF